MNWANYLTCDACKAPAGQPCYLRSGGGPEALSDLYADRPHRARPLTAPARRATATPRTPAR